MQLIKMKDNKFGLLNRPEVLQGDFWAIRIVQVRSLWAGISIHIIYKFI